MWDVRTRDLDRPDRHAQDVMQKKNHLLYRSYSYILLETIPFRSNNRLMSLCRFIAGNNAEFRSHNLQRSPRGKLWGGGGVTWGALGGGGVTWGALQNVPISERARCGSVWCVR